SEDVNCWPLVDVAEYERTLALGCRCLNCGFKLCPVARHLDTEVSELRLGVEHANDLTDLRKAIQVPGAEIDGTFTVGGVLQHGLGEPVAPAVQFCVVVKAAQLARVD